MDMLLMIFTCHLPDINGIQTISETLNIARFQCYDVKHNLSVECKNELSRGQQAIVL